MFTLDKEQVDLCFDHEHQADVLFALYRLVYDGSAADRPAWAIVKKVNGWPKLGAEAHKYITGRFIIHDRKHHPRVLAGGLWMNNGFSWDESLGAWECEPALCELIIGGKHTTDQQKGGEKMTSELFEIRRQGMIATGAHNERTLAEQGHITHYGIVPDTPCTGVCNITDAEWLHEDIWNGVDLAREEHTLTCPNEDHDECWCDDHIGTVLIGFMETQDEDEAWFKIGDTEYNAMYAPDPGAEYSAIVGEICAQVVRSMYVQNCELCSLCYPGQGNLEVDGKGGYIAYTLPPNVWGDRCPEGVHTWGNTCPKCRQWFSAHNNDGSCVQD